MDNEAKEEKGIDYWKPAWDIADRLNDIGRHIALNDKDQPVIRSNTSRSVGFVPKKLMEEVKENRSILVEWIQAGCPDDGSKMSPPDILEYSREIGCHIFLEGDRLVYTGPCDERMMRWLSDIKNVRWYKEWIRRTVPMVAEPSVISLDSGQVKVGSYVRLTEAAKKEDTSQIVEEENGEVTIRI